MGYYSDNGIDGEVEKLFGDFVGHACDVGANNGSFLSNTLHLEEKGWTVLCIEPSPLLAEEGRSRRKLWREVAAASVDSDLRYFNICTNGPNYASSSALWPSKDGGERLVEVVSRRLDRILEEAGFPKLDFLTVDCEGSERDIMAGFTVERWRPRVIVLEELSENAITIPGYTLVGKRQYDNLYVREDS